MVCDDMSPGPRETGWNRCGATVFGFTGLTCAGCFVLILDDLVERVPEVRDRFIFCGHREDFFDLAV